MKYKMIFRLLLVIPIFCFLVGCDAFVRKFTRKSKKETVVEEEMVLAPVEYKPAPTTGEAPYRQYLLYWKSWQDELIETLLANTSHKRQLDSAEEAINNLIELNKLLQDSCRPRMEGYIQRMKDIRDAIEKDIYGSNAASLRNSAERLRRDILRDFSYEKVKNDLR